MASLLTPRPDIASSARGVERFLLRSGERAAARPLLPHEIAFGVLYGVVLLALLRAPGPTAWMEVGIWSGLGAASVAVRALTIARPTTMSWRVRLGAYLLFMNVAYARLAHVVTAVYGSLVSRDGWLQRADSALFGRPLPLYVERWTHPLLSDALSACYFLLFPYIVISVVRRLYEMPARSREARGFFAGMFTVYGIGLLGYLALPAAGAYLTMPGAFSDAVPGGWMTHFNEAVVRTGSNRVDVFPSLHVAVSTFILGFDRRYAPWRFRAYLVPAIGLWVSTVYLRFHYGVDVLSGFALAAFGLWVAFRVATNDRRPIRSISP
jgi:hypothetical protein